MITYSMWNDPKTYAGVTQELLSRPMPTTTVYGATKDEKIVPTVVAHKWVNKEQLGTVLDQCDKAIVEAIAVSKFLTSLQIFEYVNLRQCAISRDRLRRRLIKLMKFCLIRENAMEAPGYTHSLKYYELDSLGYMFAKEQGVPFHRGNWYLSKAKKQELGIEETKPSDVKRIIIGNQIVLGLLLSNAQMERFGIMETFRVNDAVEIGEGSIMRPTVNVRVDKDSVLAFEVVRDTSEAYEKLTDKVQRYYQIVNSRQYLENNAHLDVAYPQLIVCGESLEHNKRIKAVLQEAGLWNKQDPILFTEDLLNIKNTLTSIYELDDQNRQCWYSLPSKGQMLEEQVA